MTNHENKMPLPDSFDNLGCEYCRRVLENAPRNANGYPLLHRTHDVGNMAKAEGGHQYFFTSTGQIAACIAKKNRTSTANNS